MHPKQNYFNNYHTFIKYGTKQTSGVSGIFNCNANSNAIGRPFKSETRQRQEIAAKPPNN